MQFTVKAIAKETNEYLEQIAQKVSTGWDIYKQLIQEESLENKIAHVGEIEAVLLPILQEFPYHLDANYILGLSYTEINEFEKAKPLLFKAEKEAIKTGNQGKITELKAQRQECFNAYADFLYRKAEEEKNPKIFEAAEFYYQRALYPGYDFGSQAYYQLGVCADKQGKLIRAISIFSRHLKYQAEYADKADDFLNIASCCMRLGEYQQAAGYWIVACLLYKKAGEECLQDNHEDLEEIADQLKLRRSNTI